MERKLGGFRPEPLDPKHWTFSDKLKPRLCALREDDVDLRPFSSPRHDQQWTNSCVANAVIKALEIKRIMKFGHAAHVDLSRLAVYFLARELMFPQETSQDAGTYVSLACDVLRRWGVCTEEAWPFDLNKVFSPPPWGAMRQAHVNRIAAFYRLDSGVSRARLVEDVIRCLRAGNPVVYGTAIGQNWFDYKPDQVLTTPKDMKDMVGRHATVLVGFANGRFIGENSWGPNWGSNGFYWMDPGYITWKESCDFWTITAPWQEVK